MTDQDPTAQFRGGNAAVSTYMTDAIVALAPTASLREAATVIAEASVGCIVVGSHGAVEGVITERDLVIAIATGRDVDTTTVADVESKRLVWAGPETSVGDVAEEMMEDYVRHVLVGDDGTISGIVSMRDVITAYMS